MPVSVDVVDPRHVAAIWPIVSHHIVRAFAKADNGLFRDAETAVLKGEALLWVIANDSVLGAVVTQIQDTDKRKVCAILACGGELFHHLHLISKLEDYARQMGCHSMRFSGRKGWVRLLKDYRMTNVILEKAL